MASMKAISASVQPSSGLFRISQQNTEKTLLSGLVALVLNTYSTIPGPWCRWMAAPTPLSPHSPQSAATSCLRFDRWTGGPRLHSCRPPRAGCTPCWTAQCSAPSQPSRRWTCHCSAQPALPASPSGSAGAAMVSTERIRGIGGALTSRLCGHLTSSTTLICFSSPSF